MTVSLSRLIGKRNAIINYFFKALKYKAFSNLILTWKKTQSKQRAVLDRTFAIL